MVKNPPANAGDARDSGSGRSIGVGNSNPLQYSHLENPMNRGTWQATVHRVPKSQTHLSTHTKLYSKLKFKDVLSHLKPLLLIYTMLSPCYGLNCIPLAPKFTLLTARLYAWHFQFNFTSTLQWQVILSVCVC